MKISILLSVLSLAAFTRAEVVSVDVYAWARTGTGETSDGWSVSNINAYADDGSVRMAESEDVVVSPLYPLPVTQLVMTVKASSTGVARFLTAVPEVASAGARSLKAQGIDSFVEQCFAWTAGEDVRRFRLQNIGSYVSGWAIRSLDVYLDRIEPPWDVREEGAYSDAVAVAWTQEARAVATEFELYGVRTVPPDYVELKDWDFTPLTNRVGKSKTFLELDPPGALGDVGGVRLGLQKYDGGHLQIGDTTAGGAMALPLPGGAGRLALVRWLRSDKDGNFSAVVATVGEADGTNECARIPLGTVAATSVVELPDAATSLLLLSERGDNRIRVEDVKIVTDYVPGFSTTNLVARSLRARASRTVAGLEPGDYLWRVRSFDRQDVSSGWTPYRAVTLDAGDPRFRKSGLAIVIK